jgi:alpha-mannosidase
MFHDTLPGSSIHLAVEDYDRKFAKIHEIARDLFEEATKVLESNSGGASYFNTLPSHARREVVSSENGDPYVVELDNHTLCGEAESFSPTEGVTSKCADQGQVD